MKINFALSLRSLTLCRFSLKLLFLLFFLAICLLLLLCFNSTTAQSWKLCPHPYGPLQHWRNLMPFLCKLANHIGLLTLGFYMLSDSRFLWSTFLSLHTYNVGHLIGYCFQRRTMGIHIHGHFLIVDFPFHLQNQLRSTRTRDRYHHSTRELQSRILLSYLVCSIYIMGDSETFWRCILVQ